MTENLRVKAAAQSPPAASDTRTSGPDQPLFGWWRPSARPDPQAARTGDNVTVHRQMRLFRLGELIRPEPGPEGAARPAARRDQDLLTEWFDAFVRDVGDPPGQDHGAAV